MKTLYLECNMGVAGDMLMSALLDLTGDAEECMKSLNALGIPKVAYEKTSAIKCGITGTHVSVKIDGTEEQCQDVSTQKNILEVHDHTHHGKKEEIHMHGNIGEEKEHVHKHGHHHSTMKEISEIVHNLDTTDQIKNDTLYIYKQIAEAESRIHGHPVEEVHFHEVGALDAIADIVGCAWLIRHIAPERIVASPVATGFGMVRCAHGILPVPAPATGILLEGIPNYAGGIEGELCTPTGAAILKYFVDDFSQRPLMKITGTGYGTGTKEFPAANILRMFLGETSEEERRKAV